MEMMSGMMKGMSANDGYVLMLGKGYGFRKGYERYAG
jgi:hypothetical protein